MYQTWSNGYFTGLSYVDGYVAQMNPLLLQFNLTLAGVKFGHADKIAPLPNMRYLELGFGKGSSLNIHAAAADGYFVGTDFNPDHALEAQNSAQISHASLKIFDHDFKELQKYLQDKEESFDIIVLHGVWSWVSVSSQEEILKIIKKHLKVGGIVYVSYNCFPGWLKTHAARTLLMQLYQQTSGNAVERIQQATALFEDFLSKNTAFTTPAHEEFLKEIKQKDPAYIAHEYLNADWNCCYFSEMLEKMHGVKCEFASSASVLDHFDVELNPLINTSDRLFKQQLQDYNINRRFRMDIFMKGRQELHIQEGINKILNSSFVLVKLPQYFRYGLKSANMFEKFIKQILDFLAQDSYRPKTGKEIFEKSGLSFRDFIATLGMIINQDVAMPTQNPSLNAKNQAKQYNHHLFYQQTLMPSSIFAASPITGGGVIVSEIEQLFIYAKINGVKTFQDIQAYVWNILKLQNRALAQGSFQAQNEQDNLNLLRESLKEFLEEKSTLFQVLEIY